ncbi:hypothetical protein MCHUDSM44219_02701 [Mycolicibacterium chubuense]|uniref:Uncharacterized protein n=1 Tax=Mycolicibacterium chubuense TaxID=1800 RepID=A0A0J6WCZ2_MYCCU|nr:hypothetical protein MCHUDSM44219_02701 [Mycolicibacterium chubuense]SPX98349.1 Uncharacterised protein [Mycolicibacterium chubuense]
MHTDERETDESGRDMTGLGASIYLGFFALAALWLFLTSDGPLTRRSENQGQRPDRSNSASTSAGSDGSSPWLSSHSARK